MKKILFIADKFDDEPRDRFSNFPGGAELTDAAVMEACPYNLKKVKFSELTNNDLKDRDLLVISNMKTATPNQIRIIASETRFILFEHDVRICRYDGDWSRARKEPVHYYLKRCVCPHLTLKKLYRKAAGVIFLTRKQYEVYRRNPFFGTGKIEFLGSSAFNRAFFERVESFREKNPNKSGTAVFYSPHYFKGFERSRDYCLERGIEPFQIADCTPDEVFDILERSEEFVYLPNGVEGAGRMPVEARFMGCKVTINENVGVGGEHWWGLDDEKAMEFVRNTPERFWKIVEKLADENTD